MSSDQDRQFDQRHVWHGWSPVNRSVSDLMVERGDGYMVWDDQGRQYVDAMASSLNGSCGYGHPRLAAAIVDQLERLHHFDHNVAANAPAARLAARIAALAGAPLTRTLFANSGSEAVEAALRMAVDYHAHHGAPRRRVITIDRGYHGTTVLCQSLSGLPHIKHRFSSPVNVTHVPLPDAAATRRPESTAPLLAAFADAVAADTGPGDVAAVLIEPFINVGGGIVLPPGLLDGLRELCDSIGALFILDEVFTGYGRTGRMFAFQHETAVPDILVSSKGLTGGYVPLSAVTTSDAVYDAYALDESFGGLRYGHTTSGHALACATGLAVLDVLEQEDLVSRAGLLGAELLAGLSQFAGHHGIVDVRGSGLVVTIEFSSARGAESFVQTAREHGLLLRVQGAAVMAMPPLIIDEAGVKSIASLVGQSLDAYPRDEAVQP